MTGGMTMKWRPIIFHTTLIPMVMDGTKTQTRRLVDPNNLRIVLPQAVDRRWLMTQSGVARAGRHQAILNQHGAVSVATPRLGLKTGEFQFCCPLADGKTVLAERDSGKKEWTIDPAPDQRLWVRERIWQASRYPGTMESGEAEPPSSCRGRLVHYAADGDPPNTPNRHYPRGLRGGKFAAPDPYSIWVKRPSIHMPRWASRTSLVVMLARLQRLQSITEEDAIAEGVVCGVIPATRNVPTRFGFVLGRCDAGCTLYPTAREAFAAGWDRLNGSRKRRVGESGLRRGGPPLIIHESATWESNPWVWAYTFKKIEVN